jgi:conjugal transfer mating pair stabilization protein TraG
MIFYAFWNGPQLADLFNAIVAITDTSDYRVLMMSLLLVGFLSVMTLSAVRYRGFDAISWFFTTLVILSIGFFPRVDITVKDVRSGAVQVISGVPFAIGFPASVTSRISWWLTETFELAFQDADVERYSRFGLAFPQRAVASLLATEPVTPRGRSVIRGFLDRCVIPEILDDRAKREELMNAPNIYALVSSSGWVNPARKLTVDNQLLSCSQALPLVNQVIAEEEIPALEQRLSVSLKAGDDAIFSGIVLQALPEVSNLMLGVSQSLSDSLKQSVLISMLPDALVSAAEKAGKAPIAAGVAIARAQGNLASEINYRTLGEMAKSALPKMRNLLEFIVIGLFPLVFLLLVGMGRAGMTILRSYLTLLISIALWAPITAIINYLVIHIDAETLNQLVQSAGGVTLSASNLIREAGASSQAMAGSLLWIVPFLAYAVAKGSDIAMTQMSSSLLNPASSAAQSQGSAVSMGNIQTGNFAMDNTNMNNANANKNDFSSAYSSPSMHRSALPQGTWIGDLSEGSVTGMSVTSSNLGVSAGAGSARSVSYASGQKLSVSTGESTAHESSEGELVSMTSGLQSSVSEGRALTEMSGNTVRNAETVSSGYSSAESLRTHSGLQSSGTAVDNFNIRSGVVSANNAIDNQTPGITNKAKTAGMPASVGLTDSVSGALAATGEPNAKAHPFDDSTAAFLNNRLSVGATGDTSSVRSAGASHDFSADSTEMQSKASQSQRSDVSQSQTSTSENRSALLSETSAGGYAETKGLRKGETFSSTSTSAKDKHISEGRNEEMRSGYDRDPMIRQEALELGGGNPAETLRMLNNSADFRRGLADSVERRSTSEDPLPLAQELPSIGHHDMPEGLKHIYDADTMGVAAAHQHATSSLDKDSKDALSLKRSTVVPRSEDDQREFFFTRGLILATSASYENETGIVSTARRAYLFGAGYNSPAETYQHLRVQSESDPDLRRSLEKLGKESVNSGRPVSAAEILRRLEN